MDSFLYLTITIQLITILVFGTNLGYQSVAQNINTDRAALLSFRSQLSLDSTDLLSTWNDQVQSPCNWTGVSCNTGGQRVIGLNISGFRIRGSISPSIGNLSFLRQLELQNNQLTGQIPDQLGNLFRLRTLNLSFNGFEGVIPSNISQCRELIIFDLMQNQIIGNIPLEISYLTNLQVLHLASNQLSGNIPPSLANISSLLDLNLGTNRLVGSIPAELARLANLRFLELSINNLSGVVPPSIYNSSSLVYLAFASNNLSGELPGDIAVTLPNLLDFNFCINQFTGTIPWSVHNLTNIQSIRMAHNRLHGTIPPGLGNLPNLEMYNIGFNSIQGNLDFLELLINSTRLDFLAIDFNLLEGEIPNSIGNLSRSLTKLYMGGNNIHGSIPPSIGDLRFLDLLNVSYNAISGEIPPEIGQLRELRVLALADNMFSGQIPNSLGILQQLTKIDLSNNELIGRIPDNFNNFQNLISMDLSNNQLNGTIPTQILTLPSLNAFLNLSQNQLTGPLPDEIRFLENVMVINISDNRLSGNIPNSISNCRSLEELLIARNTLSGPIPESLGLIRGLEILDLSSNQLSGAIPSDLQNLQSLQLLDLSFNNLEGQIPTGGVFRDPTRVYLGSNQNLCSNCSGNFHRTRGRRLTIMYIIISVSVVLSLCIAIGLIYYIRQRKQKIQVTDENLKGQHQMISYEELRVATNSFNQENLIGQGSFGFVYKGLLQGAEIAVKVLNTAIAKSKKSFLAECAALRHVRHRNLVKLITICSSIDFKNDEFLALIFEFMSNGSLDDWLNGKKRKPDGTGLSFLERLNCAIGIASAIDYLHNGTEVPIVHCDLKPSNVLLDSDMIARVSDFGLAKILLQGNNTEFSISSANTLRGSIGYIPPEYGYGENPSTTGDVYSFGILLLELFTGKSPTNKIFTGGISLRSWVEREFPSNLNHVMDEDLFQGKKIHNDAIITIFRVALSCTADSPDSRTAIRDVLHKLKSVEAILEKQEIVNQRNNIDQQTLL